MIHCFILQMSGNKEQVILPRLFSGMQTSKLCNSGSWTIIYAIPILEGLRSNVCLKTLIFSKRISDAASHAIQHLFESTTSIQRFELKHEDFRGERVFRPIAQAITNSECVSELNFSHCEFREPSSFAQFQSILQNKRNLTSLCLHCCSFGGGQINEAIISFLSRPDLPLRCFGFR